MKINATENEKNALNNMLSELENLTQGFAILFTGEEDKGIEREVKEAKDTFNNGELDETKVCIQLESMAVMYRAANTIMKAIAPIIKNTMETAVAELEEVSNKYKGEN